MRIKEITWQLRSDFYADYECEHCGFMQRGTGYDDSNFYKNVLPKIKCKKCGKTSEEE